MPQFIYMAGHNHDGMFNPVNVFTDLDTAHKYMRKCCGVEYPEEVIQENGSFYDTEVWFRNGYTTTVLIHKPVNHLPKRFNRLNHYSGHVFRNMYIPHRVMGMEVGMSITSGNGLKPCGTIFTLRDENMMHCQVWARNVAHAKEICKQKAQELLLNNAWNENCTAYGVTITRHAIDLIVARRV